MSAQLGPQRAHLRPLESAVARPRQGGPFDTPSHCRQVGYIITTAAGHAPGRARFGNADATRSGAGRGDFLSRDPPVPPRRADAVGRRAGAAGGGAAPAQSARRAAGRSPHPREATMTWRDADGEQRYGEGDETWRQREREKRKGPVIPTIPDPRPCVNCGHTFAPRLPYIERCDACCRRINEWLGRPVAQIETKPCAICGATFT